jgi:hypothetical protein
MNKTLILLDFERDYEHPDVLQDAYENLQRGIDNKKELALSLRNSSEYLAKLASHPLEAGSPGSDERRSREICLEAIDNLTKSLEEFLEVLHELRDSRQEAEDRVKCLVIAYFL